MNLSVAGKAKASCCGCRACEQACPAGCIRMAGDAEGFFYPQVMQEDCINCGKCMDICPMEKGGFRNPDAVEQTEVFAAAHNDRDVCLGSTSGGAFTAVANAFCDENFAVFGAALCNDLVVRHRMIRDLSELSLFKKSKYVQSEIGSSYRDAKALLDAGVKVLFSGVPCQIAALQSYLGRQYDNLLAVEVLCHGVPSPKVFDLYKKYLEKKHNDRIAQFDFRDKKAFGWDIVMAMRFQAGKAIANYMSEDLYGSAYLRSLCLRPCCHACPFARRQRNADITLADFWGVGQVLPDFDDELGVSLVIVNTTNGEKVFQMAQRQMTCRKANLEDAIPYNRQLAEATRPHPQRDAFMQDIMKMPIDRACRKYQAKRSILRRALSRVLSRDVKKTVKRILGRA